MSTDKRMCGGLDSVGVSRSKGNSYGVRNDQAPRSIDRQLLRSLSAMSKLESILDRVG